MAGSGAVAGWQGSRPMGKALSIAGMVIGGVLALLFILDLAIGAPFGGKAGPLPDIGLAISGAIVAYLGWNAFRDLGRG